MPQSGDLLALTDWIIKQFKAIKQLVTSPEPEASNAGKADLRR
jgi:hypothetical protein